MIRFIVSLVGGATLGGTFALICLGLVLAFRSTHTFNFAHGQMMLFPAFIIGFSQANGDSLGFSIVVALMLGAAVAAVFYYLVLRRTTGLPLFMGIICTFGLAAILDGLMGLKFRGQQYSIELPGIPEGVVHIFGVRISQESLFFAGFTIVLAVGVTAVIRLTHLGTMIRAAGQDALLAGQCGIPVRRVYMGSWAVAGVLAAIAGICYGNVAVVNTSMVGLGLAAIPAMVIGGIDSIEGAVIGGIIVGIIQGFTATYLGGEYVEVVTYTILLVVLLIRPQGLFGTQQVVRA